MKKIITFFIIGFLIFSTSAQAVESFVMDHVEIRGLQRISQSTVDQYLAKLSIRPGKTMNADQSAALIKALYQTDFFDSVNVDRSNHTLIITVSERPTIAQLKISGNSVIQTDKLTTVMRSVNIAEGRVYNPVIIDKIKQSLLNQYYQLGRYNARVDVLVTPTTRNRVNLNIVISEGLVAKVSRVTFVGNHVFSDRTLNKQLALSTPGLFTFFTETDRFSQEKLDTSLEQLSHWYQDHGYVRFAVKSSQVGITPDRKSVYVTIVVDEGSPYTVKDISLSGDLILPKATLMPFIHLKSGDTFSRQSVIDAEKGITGALGDEGYIYSTVSLDPVIDDNHKTISLPLVVHPGKKTYVRYITFENNTKTNDEVLRREVQQMESAVVSTTRLDESKHQLSLLPYVKDVQMAVMPVEHSDDQVDVKYKVQEDNAAQASLNVGYSTEHYVILGAGLNQKNFLGTGKTVGINASVSKYSRYYSLTYTDPYFTADGISRDINIYGSRYNPSAANLTSSYLFNQYGLTDVYSIPLGQEKGVFNRLQLGYGYENTILSLSPSRTPSTQVNQFVQQFGTHFQQLDLITGFSRDSRDKAIFPTSGMIHTLGFNLYLPISGDLKYYTLTYNAKWYHPLTDQFILTARGNAGYGHSFNGQKDYPFFKNYYAGGIDSVRGFLGNSLGPRDSNGDPTGGNELIDASIGLIFPNYISDSLRTTLFFDAGNVYDSFDNRTLNGSNAGGLRYAIGIEGDWLSPLGLIDLSLAKPLNLKQSKPGQTPSYRDESEPFQFSLGANFG